MEIDLSYDQINNEYSMLMGVLGASVSKHLLDGHFTCIWANDYFYDLIGYTRAEFNRLFHDRPDEYFYNNLDTWNVLKRSVRDALDMGKKGNSAYLHLVRPNGEFYWVKLQAAFMDEHINGHQVAYTTMTDVTEMMLARKEKEQTQQVYEKITHEQEMLMSALNVSVSKHLIDEHFTCVRANEYYYQLIGYPKEKYEALFHNHADEYYQNNPEGWAMLSQKVSEVLERGGDQYELIVPMKYEDGTSYWVKLFSYFTDEYIDGCRTSYTVMTNVTELVQMRAEQEMLMQAMKVSVSRHLVDEHFTVVWANDFYYELIEYSKPEYEALFHNRCDEYFHDNIASWRKIQENIQAMYAEGKRSYELFLPLRPPSGTGRWVKMVGFFTDEVQDGVPLAYTTMVEVTNLMQVQQERSIAYDNIPGFIIKHRILRDSIQLIDASERITEFFDLDLDHIKDFDVYSALQPESRAVIEANHPHFRKGEPYEGMIHAIDKNKKDRWFRIHCTCIDTVSGDPVYLTVFIDITDVTELRELQRQLEERTEMLNAALEAAKEANAAKSDFLSRMSHDIRTPMNAVVGMTEIASAHLDEPERMKDCLQKIRLSSHHLLGLINDVLDMSKIETGNFPINMAALSLPEVLREVIMITLPNVQSRRHCFDVHLIALEQEEIISDALRLRQILLNLLSNANKFTPEGGKIVFDVEQLAGETTETASIRFTVSDNGAGMKPEFMEHIFDAFTRERDSRIDRIEGSGLGMAITKRLVDLLGGDITVRSRPDVGTQFQVTLPMEQTLAAPVEPAVPGARVLLADDDPVVLTHGKAALASLGADAACASGGREAVEMVRAGQLEGHGYDLVILDLDMPQQDGLETARQIREEFPDSRLLLILSVYEQSEIREAAIKAGVNGFIEKPLFRSTLRDCLLEQLADGTRSVQTPVAYDFSGKTFLLVEDNELNREIALELLGSLGAELETAVNGEEAVRRFRESEIGHYALVLMDIQMPLMNGYEATRAIRALARSDAGTVPIIAMTADAFVEDIRNAEAAGMNGHIAKPLDFEMLGRQICQLLKETN